MKECRKERQKRLMEVYEHLRQHFGIHTKTDLAKELKYGRTSFSAAINGKEKYLTDELFEAVCDRYEGVFNLNYLLTGNGNLLTVKKNARSEDGVKKVSMVDQSSLINAALAAKDETIRAKEETIAALRSEIAAKDSLIASLCQQIETASIQSDKYPFPVGVAEEKLNIQNNI